MSRKNYIYGRHPVSEILKARPTEVHRLYLSTAGHTTEFQDLSRLADRHRIAIVVVPKHALDDLVGNTRHQGVAAEVAAFAYAEVDDMLALARERDEAPLLLALDQIQDPHNLGSLVRSATALGAHGVIVLKDRAAEVTPAVVKVSAGATAHLPIARVTNLTRTLEDLKQAGLWIIGATAEGKEPVYRLDLRQASVLVLGSEGRGLRRLVAETCDLLAHIPMTNKLGSLNAAMAGAIFLYEAARQREGQ